MTVEDALTIAYAEAQQILALSTGPWSEGKNLAPEVAEAIKVRMGWFKHHAQTIIGACQEAAK